MQHVGDVFVYVRVCARMPRMWRCHLRTRHLQSTLYT